MIGREMTSPHPLYGICRLKLGKKSKELGFACAVAREPLVYDDPAGLPLDDFVEIQAPGEDHDHQDREGEGNFVCEHLRGQEGQRFTYGEEMKGAIGEHLAGAYDPNLGGGGGPGGVKGFMEKFKHPATGAVAGGWLGAGAGMAGGAALGAGSKSGINPQKWFGG